MREADLRATRGAVRAARGSFVGVATVLLGLGAHVVAGGMAPSAAAVLVLTAVLIALCIRLSARRWSVRTTMAAFLLAQVAIHGTSMIEHPMHDMGSGTSMLLAHVVAAGVLVLVVRRAETVVWGLIEHLALRAIGLVATAVPRVVDRTRTSVRRAVLSFTRARPPGRGPPSVASAH